MALKWIHRLLPSGRSLISERFQFPHEDGRGRPRWVSGVWEEVRVNRWVAYAVLVLFILLNLRMNLRYPAHSAFWFTLATILSPAIHTFTILLLLPLVWGVRWGFSRLANYVLSFLVGLGLAEIVLGLGVVLDFWLRTKAGLPSARLWPILHGYLVLIAPSAVLIGGLVAIRARDVKEKEAVKEEAVIAKTRLLQSQLHPHVLFNALNGLAELIHKDPPAAEESVRHLADLLRRLLAASEHDSWALSEERTLVRDYLQVEGMRLGSRLMVKWDWDTRLDKVHVPPLLVQPLVENAIKHGIVPSRVGGEILIRAFTEADCLFLEVWNSGAPYVETKGWGVGLRNLTARLDLMAAKDDAFSIASVEGGTRATVKLSGPLLESVHESLEGIDC